MRRLLPAAAAAVLVCGAFTFTAPAVPASSGNYKVPGQYAFDGAYNSTIVQAEPSVTIDNWNPNGPNMTGKPERGPYDVFMYGTTYAQCDTAPYGPHGRPPWNGWQTGHAGHIYEYGPANWSFVSPGENCQTDYWRVEMVIYLRGDGHWTVNGSTHHITSNGRRY